LSRIVYPGDAFTSAEREAQMAALTATEAAQSALGAVEAGLTRWLAQLGVRPDMAAGHSYGELAALQAAGAFGFDDLIRLSEARGRAMVENGDPARPGAMAAVAADENVTRAAIEGGPDVVIANLNSPSQTVIAGAEPALEEALDRISAAGLNARRVPVSQAFHSPLMAAAIDQFTGALSEVAWSAPLFPVYANVTTRPHEGELGAMRETMARHLMEPVDFASMV
jgi:acyl transferase domain-containing protein